MNEEIINYIKEARKFGLSEREIKQNLLDAGWEGQTVEDSFAHLKAESVKPQTNLNQDIKLHAEQNPEQTSNTIQPVSLVPKQISGHSSKTVKILVALGVAVLAAGGLMYYKLVYASPGRVWKKYTELKGDKIYSSDFKFSYRDSDQSDEKDISNFPFNNIKLEFQGKTYSDITDVATPQSESEINYSFSSGNTSFQTGFEYRLIGKKFYFNAGNNPFTQSFFSSLVTNKKVEWVSIDFSDLEKTLDITSEEGKQKLAKLKKIINPNFVKEIQDILSLANFVKVDKYLNREKINGIETIHFQNSLDKAALKNALMSYFTKIIDELQKVDAGIKPESDKTLKQIEIVLDNLIAKAEIKQFETWIGLKDFRLYRIRLKTSAPSVRSAMIAAVKAPQESARDVKRLTDVRQIASALELYFTDNARYPASYQGKPQGLSPKYIDLLPEAPLPADGNCTDYYNTYWYEVKNDGQSYEMTFCLGKSAGGYDAGILKLSPAGITMVEGCPSTPENCYKSGSPENQSQENQSQTTEDVQEIIGKIDFDAELDIETDYSNYGVKKEITTPENAFDLLELIKQKNFNAVPAL